MRKLMLLGITIVIVSCQQKGPLILEECWKFSSPIYQAISDTPRNGSFTGSEYINQVSMKLRGRTSLRNIQIIGYEDGSKRRGRDTLLLPANKSESILDHMNWEYINIEFPSSSKKQTTKQIIVGAKWIESSVLSTNHIYKLHYILNRDTDEYSLEIRWIGVGLVAEQQLLYRTRGVSPAAENLLANMTYDSLEALSVYRETVNKYEWMPINLYNYLDYSVIFPFVGAEIPENWDTLTWPDKRTSLIPIIDALQKHLTRVVVSYVENRPYMNYFLFENRSYLNSPLVIATVLNNHQWVFPRQIVDGNVFEIYNQNPNSSVANIIDEYKRVGLIDE